MHASAENGIDFSVAIDTVLLQMSMPDQVQVLFLLDQIAQEELEVVQLQLSVPDANLPSGGIFQDTITLVIRDSDDKSCMA